MDYLKAVIIDCKDRGIVLDTNLLLLLVVGMYDSKFIKDFKRLRDRGYEEKDFEILKNLTGFFSNIYVTPHILSELSNLSFGGIRSKKFSSYLSRFIEVIKGTSEHFVGKNILMNNAAFKFGFADTSILELSVNKDLPVVTDDLPFFNLLVSNKVRGININHLRMWNI